MAIIKNASTIHPVNVLLPSGKVKAYPPQDKETFKMPRAEMGTKVVDEIDEVPISEQAFGTVYDLPKEENGVFWIVSRIVAENASDRHDLLVPGPQKLGEDGKVRLCEGLSRLPRRD